MPATTVNLVLGAPTFQQTNMVNTLYCSTSPDMAGAVVVGTPGSGYTFQHTYTTAVGKLGIPVPILPGRLDVQADGWPDYASNPSSTVRSCIVGPVGSATSGVLAVAGW